MKSRVYLLMAGDPERGGLASRCFDACLMALIVANVIAVILESVEGIFLHYRELFYTFELFSVTVFSIEYILRLWTCTETPDYHEAVLGRVRYAFTPMALVDLVAILPFFLPMLIPMDLRFVRAARLLRLFRLRELPRASRAGLPASWPTLAPQRCDVEVLAPQAQRAVPSPRGGYLPQHCNLYRQQTHSMGIRGLSRRASFSRCFHSSNTSVSCRGDRL